MYIGFSNLSACMGSKKPHKIDILKIKHTKSTNRNFEKANKQDIGYYSIDSKGQDNIQLPL